MPFVLLSILLAVGPEPVPALRLVRGQELVYVGHCTEDAFHDGGRFVKRYELQVRLFVIDSNAKGTQAALLTVVRLADQPTTTEPGSVRLEMVSIDPRGRLRLSDGQCVNIALDGPPILDNVGIIERSPVANSEQVWGEMEPNRGPRLWGLAGDDAVVSGRKLILVGRQESMNWDRPDVRPAWRRLDTAWLAGDGSIVQRLDRVIERRDPTLSGTRSEIRTKYELESSLTLPESLFDDRCREIRQAVQFQKAMQAGQMDAVRTRIGTFLDRQPATPYREAILALRRRLDSSAESDLQPAQRVEEKSITCRLGQPAPDFVTCEVPSGRMVHLQSLRGRPVVLAFVKPSTPLGRACAATLREIQSTQKLAYFAVAALDADQEPMAGVTTIDARDLGPIYVDRATPRFVVIDRNGAVACVIDGWGPEVATLLDRAVNSE